MPESLSFTGFVLLMLAMDLGLFHRKGHVVSLREARLVGDRIYLIVLIADQAGQAEIEVLETGAPGTQVERY